MLEIIECEDNKSKTVKAGDIKITGQEGTRDTPFDEDALFGAGSQAHGPMACSSRHPSAATSSQKTTRRCRDEPRGVQGDQEVRLHQGEETFWSRWHCKIQRRGIAPHRANEQAQALPPPSTWARNGTIWAIYPAPSPMILRLRRLFSPIGKSAERSRTRRNSVDIWAQVQSAMSATNTSGLILEASQKPRFEPRMRRLFNRGGDREGRRCSSKSYAASDVRFGT